MNMLRRDERALNPWRHWWTAFHDKSGEPRWVRQVLDALDLHPGQSVLAWRGAAEAPPLDEAALLGAMVDLVGPEGRITVAGPMPDPALSGLDEAAGLRAPWDRRALPSPGDRVSYDRILLSGLSAAADLDHLAGLLRYGGRVAVLAPTDAGEAFQPVMEALRRIGPVVATTSLTGGNVQVVVVLHRPSAEGVPPS